MDTRAAFANALRKARAERCLTQEDFSLVSSRTYLSTLERGLKSPTLDKIDAIASVLDIHPLTLLVLTFLGDDKYKTVDDLLQLVVNEISELDNRHI